MNRPEGGSEVKSGWLKSILAVLLLVLVMGSLILFAGGSSQVYLLSVNDKVMEMTAENMPLVSGNQLYIPYTMLSSQATGINLGVRAQYRAARGTLTVTDGRLVVTFDIRKNTAHDAWGTPQNATALVKNNMVYIPVDWLCRFFEQLNYSLTYTSFGILVRLTNDAVVLTDEEFIDAADSQLRQNYLDYQNALKGQGGTASPTQTQTASPTASPSPTQSPAPSQPVATVRVYTALRWGEKAGEAARLLEQYDQRGLFLFTCRELMEQDDLVRRLIAGGHQVGLSLEGADAEDCLNQLAQGRELLEAISHSPVLIVSAAKLSRQDAQRVTDTGCALWSAQVYADGLTWRQLSRKLDAEQDNRVEFTCDEAGVELLEEVLPRLAEEPYQLCRTLAPSL